MFDFALSQSGDVIFTEKEHIHPPFKLSFTTTAAIKISFDVSDFSPMNYGSNGIKLIFNVKELDNNKRAITIHDTNAKIQLLKIKLSTALGELPQRKTIGSKLELARHKSLYDSKTIATVQEYVKDAIIDIIPNASVRVSPSVEKNGKYSQLLDIYIFEDDLLIFKYALKG